MKREGVDRLVGHLFIPGAKAKVGILTAITYEGRIKSANMFKGFFGATEIQ